MGLFDHKSTNPDNGPMASVRMLDAEKVANTGKLFRALNRFETLKLGSRFNISLVEFLDMPFFMVELLIEVAAVPNKDEAAAIAAAMLKLNKP